MLFLPDLFYQNQRRLGLDIVDSYYRSRASGCDFLVRCER